MRKMKTMVVIYQIFLIDHQLTVLMSGQSQLEYPVWFCCKVLNLLSNKVE